MDEDLIYKIKYGIKLAIVGILIIGGIVGFFWLLNNSMVAGWQKANAELQQKCDAAQGQFVLGSDGKSLCYFPKPTGAGR